MKKKILGFVFALMFVLVPAAVLIGCGKGEVLESIELTMANTTLFQGQKWEETVPVETATYKKCDKTRTEVVAADAYAYIDFDTERLGTHNVTAYYQDKKDTLQVNVISVGDYYQYVLETAADFAKYANQKFILEIYGDDFGSSLTAVDGQTIYVQTQDVYGLEDNSAEDWLFGKTLYHVEEQGYIKREYETEALALKAILIGAGDITVQDSYAQTLLDAYKTYIDFEISDIKAEVTNGNLVFTSESDTSVRVVIDYTTHLVESFTRSAKMDSFDVTFSIIFGTANIPSLPYPAGSSNWEIDE